MKSRFRTALIAIPALMFVTGCATRGGESQPPSLMQTAAVKKGVYLGGSLPGGLDLVPPPPAAGSAAEARDRAGADAATLSQSGARWDLAIKDANLAPGRVAAAFSCAAGISITKEETPVLVNLLSRASLDLGGATGEVKKRYMRPRPFMVNGKPSCTPTWEAILRRDGSYPSGHSAIGFGISLILSEIVPDRAGQIVTRGRAFGDSRRICNVHWLSDIEEGRLIATVNVMRLNADASFQADLKAARAEVSTLRSKPSTLPTNCAEEARILAPSQ